jgi:hypothetical protein
MIGIDDNIILHDLEKHEDLKLHTTSDSAMQL